MKDRNKEFRIKAYDYAVVIGRFEPFHNAHQELIKHALKVANDVIVVFGSAHKAPETKNPWTPAEREAMVRSVFSVDNLHFTSVRDYPYNDNLWVAEIQNKVSQIITNRARTNKESGAWSDKGSSLPTVEEAKVALVGYFKDETSYYLNYFPQWTFEQFHPDFVMNATHVREKLFKGDESWRKLVPPTVEKIIDDFCTTETYTYLKKDFDYNAKYKEDTKFVGASFPATFVTTDAVVLCGGHILVIKRGRHPGKGLYALPGGFLQEGKRIVDSAIAEVKEETSIRVDPLILKGSIKETHDFDHPDRDPRGRTVTHAFFIDLKISLKDGLPFVEAGDDANEAFWMPLSDVNIYEDKFFNDHVHIIRHFLGF